jgi:hypothetical protein
MDEATAFVKALGAAKLGFDTIRSVLGIIKDAGDVLPEERRAAVAEAIEQSSRQFDLAEVEIAKALGYELCRCEFPPTIMLTAGSFTGRGSPPKTGPVYECPKCGHNTSAPFTFARTKMVYQPPA